MSFNDWLNKIKIAANGQAPEQASPSFLMKKEISDYQAKISKEKDRPASSLIPPAFVPPAKEETAQKKILPTEKSTKPMSAGGGIIKTNLIKGEIITFFDWQKAWYQIAAYIAAALLILAGLYACLFFYEKVKSGKVSALAEQAAFKGAKIVAMKQEISNIAADSQRLSMAEELINNHVYWTNFFLFLEENTLSTVKYDGFSGDLSGKYSLKARTKDFINLAEQINVLRASSWVKSASTSGGQQLVSGLNEEAAKFLISFPLDLLIDPALFTNYVSRGQ